MYGIFRVRTRSVALWCGAIATVSLLHACTPPSPSQTQASSPAATTAPPNSTMDHSSMDHGMSMNLGPADAEFDLRFIDAMIPHHEGAVQMAQEAQQKSQRPEIQKLAGDIISAQNKEVASLNQWRQAWYANASPQPVAWSPQMGHAMPMSSEQRKSMAMDMNLGAADAEFDLRFINAMIPHHEGAVQMAKDALNKSKRPEILQLAQAIIKSQEDEIQQMQQWKQTWYQR